MKPFSRGEMKAELILQLASPAVFARFSGMETQAIIVTGISNREFIERYAAAGRVGLCGGITKIDTAIRLVQRHQHPGHRWSDWSHAFLFEGRRA